MERYFHSTSRAVTSDWMLRELHAPHDQILRRHPGRRTERAGVARHQPDGEGADTRRR